jgi:hypothetical protein
MKAWIYFLQIEGGGPIKIGRSQNPIERARGIAISMHEKTTLLGAMLSSRADEEEQRIHRRLKAHLLRGEWFNGPAALVEFSKHERRMKSCAFLHEKFSTGIPKMFRPKTKTLYIRTDAEIVDWLQGIVLDRGRPHTFASVASEMLKFARVHYVAPVPVATQEDTK